MDDAVCGALICKSFGNYVVLDLADQPAGEAAAAQMAMDMAELCKRIAWDDEVRVVVLSFHGGMDKEFQTGPYSIDAAERLSLAEPVAGLKQPVIAAIRGDALGPGLELALACDIRIGTENSRFGLPQIRQGTMPADGGTQRLPRLVGQGKAMQMVLTGEPIDAEEACRLGLIQRIVPRRKPDANGDRNGPRHGGEIPLVAQLRQRSTPQGIGSHAGPGDKDGTGPLSAPVLDNGSHRRHYGFQGKEEAGVRRRLKAS